MADKLVIIDGNSIMYRSFYALPLLSNSEGEYSNAIYGFAMQIINIINNIKPKYMVVAFDAAKHTFRNDLFDGYKANRKPMPDELRGQIASLKEMLKLMNITIVEQQGIEGDDVIGIISKRFLDTETIIVTGDRDSFQLVDDVTSVYFTKKRTSDVKIVDVKELKNEYGVSPKQFIDLKALQGDTADNIPGVAGVGPKTATDLIAKYGSIEKIYECIDEISGKLKEKLEANKDMAFLSKKLATILTQGEIDLKLADCVFDYPFSNSVFEFFKKYEFKTLLKNEKNFDLSKGEKQDIDLNIIEVKNANLIKNIKNIANKSGFISFFIETNKIEISFGGDVFSIPLYNDLLSNGLDEFSFFDEMRDVFESQDILKISFDSKRDMYNLKKYKIELNNYFDISIAKYLVDGVPVDSVKDVFFDEKTDGISYKMVKFYNEYRTKIEDEGLHYLFFDVENKLSKVLFSMEEAGFKIDEKVLNELKIKYENEINELSAKIYELAGEEFNINSPKQLGEILYDKLGLSHKKKKSTSAENLAEIENEHEIVKYILRFRKVSKFLNTYVSGIYPHIDANKFVHTYFKQTFTTTGRLSSTEPNLQNIPIRSEESREIRSMFVASNEDSVLIDADYSQIELRILAHMSKDPLFVDAFNNGDDIHTQTASSIYGLPKEIITKDMRRSAKVVNFGIIYGMSEYGLAEDLHIKPKEAKEFIMNYYAKHKAVDDLMNGLIQTARDTGKATTLFGRTRKMFDINASNYMLRMRAERASQNMPLQGTAADIIKIAMVNIFDALKAGGFKAKLIMQVHDELIIDCPKNEEVEVKKLLENEMKNACKLIVPLEVDVASSFRWSEGH
ncbi:MAG: DNA polymerase I [Clostridia bacterium]|nr:DNA polymerase I [Clostridia bacterium]